MPKTTEQKKRAAAERLTRKAERAAHEPRGDAEWCEHLLYLRKVEASLDRYAAWTDVTDLYDRVSACRTDELYRAAMARPTPVALELQRMMEERRKAPKVDSYTAELHAMARAR